jgi:hypothetical protein
MQFSTSSISVRTPERMQFGKRADHQPLRSTVKRTLKVFRPTLSTLQASSQWRWSGSLRPRRQACVFGPRERVVRAEYRPAPITFPSVVLHDVVAIERSGCTRRPALLERDPVADRVPRATNGKPCGANIKCPRCEGSLPRCEA